MAEAKQIVFTYKEVVECLIKKQGIHEGIWGIFLRFGIQGANVGPTGTDISPAAIVPVVEIGLQRMDEISNIAVDAGVVNPVSKSKKR
jgi:hypothetical protein